MPQAPQSLKNHIRFDPVFHFFLGPISFVLFIGGVVNLVRYPGWSAGFHALAGLWALTATFKLRLYALRVQDRVIRLEERLRLRELLPAGLQPQIGGLSVSQLIGLRFASDGEVAELVEKAAGGGWNQKQIKEAIRDWRADTFRV